MIPLPSRKKLQRRTVSLYERLYSALQHATVSQVEDVMRKIHIINHKIKAHGYTPQKETTEIFDND